MTVKASDGNKMFLWESVMDSEVGVIPFIPNQNFLKIAFKKSFFPTPDSSGSD